MRTIINCDEYEIELTNENLDNDNYVEIGFFKDGESESPILTVAIDDLFPALIGFEAQRSRETQRQLDLKELSK